MPELRIAGRMYPSGHANDAVHAMMMLLEDWFQAMESGSVVFRQPDPSYQRSGGRPQWTEDDLERLVIDLDAEIDQEVKRAPGTSTGSNAGSGFHRLALPQRLALAQQLDALIQQFDGQFPASMDGAGEPVRAQSRPAGVTW